jgi:GNAT superfamily N-acetyltransferase
MAKGPVLSGGAVLVVERVAEGPGENALYGELYQGLRTPMPDTDTVRWPAPSGVVAAREGGDTLVGWAVFFAHGKQDGEAAFQWVMVDRERQRIEAGHNTEHPGTPEEVAALAALASAAAERAREAGYISLRWQPAEPGLAERLAEVLHARTVEDDKGFRFHRLALRPPATDGQPRFRR